MVLICCYCTLIRPLKLTELPFIQAWLSTLTIITTLLSDSGKTACSESNRNESPLVFANCDNLYMTTANAVMSLNHTR